MRNVEFEENKDVAKYRNSGSKISFTMRFFEKVGVTNNQTVTRILFGIALLLISITIYLYTGIIRGSTPSKPSSEEIKNQMKMLREMPTLRQ